MVFPRATQAVAAAVASQRALAAETWSEGGAVACALASTRGNRSGRRRGTGLDVIRGARIKEAGHGGQVLLSKATAALMDALIDGLSLGPRRASAQGPPPSRTHLPAHIRTYRPTSRPSGRWIRTGAHAPASRWAVLTTVLCVDVAGATEARRAGDLRWLEVQAQYTALVGQELPATAGRR